MNLAARTHDTASLRHVALAHATDIDGYRRLVRALLAVDEDPDRVMWHVLIDDAPSLFQPQCADDVWNESRSVGRAAPLRIPRWLDPIWRAAFLHRDPQRHALIHRLLWRLQREPALRHAALDADVVRLRDMAHAVRRDLHRMKAFVRFRHCPHLPQVLDAAWGHGRDAVSAYADSLSTSLITGPSDATALTVHEAPPTHSATRASGWLVAWYEPEHHVTEAIAPHFMKRLANERWALLTPEASLCWQGGQLQVGPGASAADAPPPDAGEALWLTYYAHIFNPARLKPQAMQHHMPQKHWHNLPEATLISGLIASAHERSQRMINEPATDQTDA